MTDQANKMTDQANKVLFTDGSWRMVRSKYKGTIFTYLQHHHPNEGLDDVLFSWGGWVYCWNMEKQCKECGVPTPETLRGLRMLTEWER